MNEELKKSNEILFSLIDKIGKIEDFETKLSIASALYLNVISQVKYGNLIDPSQEVYVINAINENINGLSIDILKTLKMSKEEYFNDVLYKKNTYPEYADVFDETMANMKQLAKEIKND